VALTDVLARTAQGRALIDRAVIADNRGFTDNDGTAVVDKQPLAYFCGRVDLDARNVSCPLAYGTRGKEFSAFI
jgi:hypothetical protein